MRSKLDDLVEPELKSTLAHMTPRLSTHHRGHNESVIRQIEMMDQAHLKRKKAETAAIIAAAAAVQKAEEQRALLEAAAATEAQSKEEERKAECEWRWKEQKERKDGVPVGRRGASGEDSHEKRLLKLIGAVDGCLLLLWRRKERKEHEDGVGPGER
ncbi:hypothetical protein EDB85DRAFT_1116614 [Lactarius pseudohatsudake]|nr:hypothetical protein EDB85DRAFT_1116614 [Lactarius pseudohatsudake]